jgi:hypothetical protein
MRDVTPGISTGLLHQPFFEEHTLAAPIRITEYARLRGVSDEAVRKAIKSGRLKSCVVLVKDKPWIGDVLLANREWELNTDTKHHRKDAPPPFTEPVPLGSLATAPARAAFNRKVKAPPPDTSSWINPNIDPSEFDDPNAIDPATGVPRQSVSRARKEHFDAVHAQAKAELLAGTQVNREEVTRAAFSVAREVRDALFLIKDRLADELATMTDPNQIGAYLDTEFRNALIKLAEGVVLERPDAG